MQRVTPLSQGGARNSSRRSTIWKPGIVSTSQCKSITVYELHCGRSIGVGAVTGDEIHIIVQCDVTSGTHPGCSENKTGVI